MTTLNLLGDDDDVAAAELRRRAAAAATAAAAAAAAAAEGEGQSAVSISSFYRSVVAYETTMHLHR